MKRESRQDNPDGIRIELSEYSDYFLKSLSEIKQRNIDPDAQTLSVSQTVSFFAILYEKIRNAVEFREEHLIRRAAIERILSRRLALNPSGQNEAENLIRELMWARYIPPDSITINEIDDYQSIIDRYLDLKHQVLSGRSLGFKQRLAQYINDFLTCELEEELNTDKTQKKAAFLHYFYQVLNKKIAIDGITDEELNSYFYVSCEAAFAKNDIAYTRYHLMQLQFDRINELSRKQYELLVHNFENIVTHIDKIINNPFHDRLNRFTKRQVPPFLILFSIIDRYPKNIRQILTNKTELWNKVDEICRSKYQETSLKLRNAAIRSIIYIFLTKAVFALLLEYPLSKWLYGAIHWYPLAINSIFPVLLMGLIVSFVRIPGSKNTKKINERVVNILNKDPGYETSKNFIAKKAKQRRPFLLLGFTTFYLFTFGATFMTIYMMLAQLGFNPIGMIVFIFFVSLVAFFGYRIRQTTKKYTLADKPGVLSPIVD